MNKEIIKTAALAIGVFAILVTANIASEAIYTNSKVGLDKKTLIYSSVLGITLAGIMVYISKK